ncbi:Xylem serine proteinase 1 [Platanthera zijinensis]|uniref:Xylem serine proteinase 1 n=1 Tax=Platanthera zijinensis TaxID=2320716 RepID=A0AAP0GFY3_9ASPA
MATGNSLFTISLFLAAFFYGVLYAAESSAQTYIVYMGDKLQQNPELVTASHHSLLSSFLGSDVEAQGSKLYSYTHGFSGFAAMLTEAQAEKLQQLPEIISVKLGRTFPIHTTQSWDFLGLTQNGPTPSDLLTKTNHGDGIIIGVIDTGIWPESKSFSDEGYGPVPLRWKGKCQTGQSFAATDCSRKIIGARWYAAGVDNETLKEEFLSPRDANGHGTHTASTAAGGLVHNASFRGLGAGTARGGAPNARLAIYKACWGSGRCSEAGVLKAIDDAMGDGVDVLSLSIGGDGFASATVRAVAKGINVVFSGGNSGPGAQTVENGLPWLITVAATTVDRSFATVITLGNNQKLVGQSIFSGNQPKFTKLIYAQSCSTEILNATKVAKKIVLCYDPSSVESILPRFDISNVISNIQKARASGLIYVQYPTNTLDNLLACKGIPCVLIDAEIAAQIDKYMTSARIPIARVSRTVNTIGEEISAPRVGAFSSRGPCPEFPTILKPDIAAPGVSILAAVQTSYLFLSGTSMACPHVSGIAALLKALHPTWSPAAIKSAITTTASTEDAFGLAIKSEGVPRKIGDPFDYGGGHINPNKAADPGLVYDIDPKEYFEFFNCTIRGTKKCEADSAVKPLYLLNLPSVSIPALKTSVNVKRTVTNVGAVNAVYRAVVRSPPGIELKVAPSELIFDAANKTQSFSISLRATRRVQGDYSFGSLTWSDGGWHSVTIAIAARVVVQDFYADTA